MVRKGVFRPGSLAIYFEVDSKVPEKEPFMFLAQKHFKIKIQKYGNFYSQGLLMAPSDFNWHVTKDYNNNDKLYFYDVITNTRYYEGDFLTKRLEVTYNDPEDQKRKAVIDKYQPMFQKYNKFFRKPIIKKIIKTELGKEFFYAILGKSLLKKKKFPTHLPYVKITDEERVENMTWVCGSEKPWVKTLKIDGTSTTFILERKGKKKFEFYVCSRQVRQLTPKQSCYFKDEGNVYWEMAFKYDIKNVLTQILKENPQWSYVCLQGETAGPALQGNPHKLPERRFYGYNFIDSESGRWGSIAAKEYLSKYNILWVPIVDTEYYIPKDLEEFKLSADGDIELEDASGIREGYVYRSLDGKESFKNVSRLYQCKVLYDKGLLKM